MLGVPTFSHYLFLCDCFCLQFGYQFFNRVPLNKINKNEEFLFDSSTIRTWLYRKLGACLLGESVSHNDIIRIPWLFPDVIRYIRWPGCARLVFEAPQICFHFIKIGFELDLMGERNMGLGILVETIIGCAVYHHPTVWVCLQPWGYRGGKNYFEFYAVSCLFAYLNDKVRFPCCTLHSSAKTHSCIPP